MKGSMAGGLYQDAEESEQLVGVEPNVSNSFSQTLFLHLSFVLQDVPLKSRRTFQTSLFAAH